jgi:MFS transporter, DHA1 family, multidrug resistance protein
MTLRVFLVLMTVVAVISDSMLHPFYPQYFARVFGVENPLLVGLYIAACSLTVLTTFPLWALLSRRMRVLELLVITQVASAGLSVLCSVIDSLLLFWLVSLGMMVCKASYLLIYPYVMSLEDEEKHLNTIGLLAFAVYFSNILAALLSGVIFQLLPPTWLFVVMAAGDLLQVLLCLYWLTQRSRKQDPDEAVVKEASAVQSLPPRFVAKLGAVMLVLYFSAYLSEPFFASYWESISGNANKVLSGMVFAIPGLAALTALFVNSKTRYGGDGGYSGILPAIGCGVLGLLLQASGASWLVLSGRFLYGWALFQAMVRLDGLLFRMSTKASYATDFSKVNSFQGLGVLLSSTLAGSLVSAFGVRLPMGIAAFGFVLGAVLYALLFRAELRQRERAEGDAAREGSALT